jgi:aldose 1-epimerase
MPGIVRTRRDGLDAIELAAGELEATFVPGAGMVCCSLRHAGEELLAQRAGLREYAEKGRTMGIPLLHPWANRLAGWSYEALGRSVDLHRLEGGVVKADGDTGLPIHGALPGPWRLVETGDGRLVAEQHPTWEPGFRAAFPFDHRIGLAADLSAGMLRIAATVTAADPRVPVAFGFHPYLTLPGVAREDCSGTARSTTASTSSAGTPSRCPAAGGGSSCGWSPATASPRSSRPRAAI